MSNIVGTATAAGSFKTLVAAVQAAGLGGTLSGPGPFTVFAPTDEAFAELPAGTVEGLRADIPKLTKILTFHVVPGKLMAADVVTLTPPQPVPGQNVSVPSPNAPPSVPTGLFSHNEAPTIAVAIDCWFSGRHHSTRPFFVPAVV